MWSRRDHGPLPWLLLALTITTGLVDAFSILELGRVFVANMTGNVVFVAFALAGAPGFSLGSSLSALAGFLVGAAAGGASSIRWPVTGRSSSGPVPSSRWCSSPVAWRWWPGAALLFTPSRGT